LRWFAQGYATAFFSATDSLGRRVEIQRLVSYPHDAGWNGGSRTVEPTLTVDRPSYEVGDTVLVRIENVQPGGMAWLAVASGDRIESHVLRLSGDIDTVRLPLRQRQAPRVTLTAIVWYPEGGNALESRVATTRIDLEVRDPAARMAVTMQLPDHGEAASIQRMVVTADVGHSALDRVEVLVWAVDARLAAVDSLRMPDVTGALLRPPPAEWLTVSSLRDPAPVAYVPIDPGSAISIGTWDRSPDVLEYGPLGERGTRQLDDVPGPLLLGVARAGRDGTATLDLRLPDAVGRYRVIAVALTGSRLGSAERVITVESRP
jgi:uncharacterized protein YfaS (alpha-2-macroglobulin family)